MLLQITTILFPSIFIVIDRCDSWKRKNREEKKEYVIVVRVTSPLDSVLSRSETDEDATITSSTLPKG